MNFCSFLIESLLLQTEKLNLLIKCYGSNATKFIDLREEQTRIYDLNDFLHLQETKKVNNNLLPPTQ